MSSPAPQWRSGPLSLAAGLLALVGVAAFGYGVAELLATRANRAIVGSGTGILLLGYAVLLVVVARGVWRGRRWSRAPAIATQLIQLPIAWSFRGGVTWWFALVLGVVSAIVIICVLLPTSTAIFVPESVRDDNG